MSEQAKPTCPFCGAAVKPGWAGSVYWFDCGTMTDALDRDDREDQSTQCAQAERDRLAKELAEAQERIRRLEEAADLFLERMAAHISQCGWCNGSQRDNDGENEINKPCPKCGQAWADLGSFAKEAKEAKEAKA